MPSRFAGWSVSLWNQWWLWCHLLEVYKFFSWTILPSTSIWSGLWMFSICLASSENTTSSWLFESSTKFLTNHYIIFSQALRKVIREQVAAIMVLPNKLVIPLSAEVPAEVLKMPEPEVKPFSFDFSCTSAWISVYVWIKLQCILTVR